MRKQKFSKQKLFEMFFDVEQNVLLEKICWKHNVSMSTASRIRRSIIPGYEQDDIAKYILKAAEEYKQLKRPRGHFARLAIIILKHNYFLRKQHPGKDEKYYIEKLFEAFEKEKGVTRRKIYAIINYKNEFQFLKNILPGIIKRIQQTGDPLEICRVKGSKPEANYMPKKTGKEIANTTMINRFIAAWKTAIKKFNRQLKEFNQMFENMYKN